MAIRDNKIDVAWKLMENPLFHNYQSKLNTIGNQKLFQYQLGTITVSVDFDEQAYGFGISFICNHHLRPPSQKFQLDRFIC